MRQLEAAIDECRHKGLLEHIAVRVGEGERVLYETFRGGVTERTLFDMASVTKIMATTTLALLALDRGLVRLDDGVDKFFKTEKPLTVRHLLTHTVGIGHKSLKKKDVTYSNVAEKILDIPSDIPIGEDVLYSCPGFVLLGRIIEKVFEKPLPELFEELVAHPLGLCDTSFRPKDKSRAVNANLDEALRGVVNDYNCRHLGGAAGNAGLFSTLADVTKYVQFINRHGAPIISKKTFLQAAENYTKGMSQSRGLGFVYVDEKYSQTGGLFKNGSIGHCGHTGQSVFVDVKTGFYVIILSDTTLSVLKKYGEERYSEVMLMRESLHSAIKRDLAILHGITDL